MNGNELHSQILVNTDLVLQEKLESARKSLSYHIEQFEGTYADDLWQAMEHRGLNQVQFAAQAGVSKQFLTKVFRGGNWTSETMVKLAFALNYKISVHLTPNEVGCAWIHCIDEASPRPPERFIDLWTESGYQPSVVIRKGIAPDCEKFAA
jgi:transcriptional regulator with XRE-family HTH domain